jgi:hypothetical protein
MGDSLPPPAGFDLVDSLARLRGSDVEIVLREPKAELVESARTIVLKQRGRRASGTVELIRDGAGTRLVCRVARSDLTDGIWSLTLRGESDEPMDARLLVQGRRPLVLLWGAKTKPSLVPSRRGARTGKQRLAAGAGRALDAALRPLPPERAARVRRQARHLARRVLK